MNCLGGGSAELSLSEPQNVLESGVEITVQPPGKNREQPGKPFRRREGTGCHFALFCHHEGEPTAFLRADEIEAALDDVNVTRLQPICAAFRIIRSSSLSRTGAARWKRQTCFTASPCRMKAFPSC